ncbi:LOW QUALITY PROTEIN: Protein of unknown function DUF2309 [Leptonema illini DSM 21528]|uniref:Probable inorganic carbon transporter subunit DabA n=1 Tax=Leptonema illini DSM 21528 TaxID=929563 RepID=H2CAD6_9LEPT|nr:LOW QUALITY PROTEIN: Protein of unknown function DUF2309 [Leptonema illini DSM 21528]
MIDDALHDEVEEALKCVAPSWPLQNTVAVNPFWFMKDRSFIEALSSLESATHASLVWPLDHYLKDLEGGRISEAALERALADESKVSSAPIPETIDELIEASRNEIHAEAGHPTTLILSCAEAFLPESRWNVTIINECGKHAAAYFDRRQAIAGLPSARNKEGFFESWKQEIRFDRSMDFFGLKGLRDCAREFAEASSREAIAVMLHELAIHSHTERVLYMQRLITTVIGWATHFRFHEWQAELTNTATHIQTEDLLAVRMIYDLACFRAANEMKQRRPEIDMAIAHWKKSLQAELHTLSLRRIWLRAAEYSFQDTAAVLLQGFTSSQASLPASGSPSFPELTTNASGEENPWMHVVFCIDVRSELLRRHLELSDSGIETSGFAGFFGMPVAYQKSTEARETSRLPALLAPAFHLEESAACRQNYDLRARTFTESYFRNLRKAPISSFLFVELFGILALGRVLRRNLTNLRRLFGIRVLPQRFRDRGFDHTDPYQRAGISHADRVQLAENALRRMGMRRFAPLIVLAGHGSVTANNAFGSSLDCGACGGHSGDINARLLASLLNDRDIRASLAERGVSIPDETVFVAAVHETVTDEIYLLDSRSSSARERNLLKRAQDVFAKASLAARKERQASRTRRPTALPHRRAHDWSEVRPSWGLAGNAGFIAAPRSRTRGVNLNGRFFLHDYDWRHDTDFQTLRLILTAPMVVASWINLQYYASTVAPQVYGAGNKTLHNPVGEFGVVEGNGGDLRVGLPFQSVHDGERFVHEPLRLSVFIEAPLEEIERIVNQNEAVRQLVDGEWLHLLVIDESGAIKRREAHIFEPVQGQVNHRPLAARRRADHV